MLKEKKVALTPGMGSHSKVLQKVFVFFCFYFLSSFFFFCVFFPPFLSVLDILNKGLIEHVVRESKAESFETSDIPHMKKSFLRGRMRISFLFVCFLSVVVLVDRFRCNDLSSYQTNKQSNKTNPMGELA